MTKRIVSAVTIALALTAGAAAGVFASGTYYGGYQGMSDIAIYGYSQQYVRTVRVLCSVPSHSDVVTCVWTPTITR